MVKHRHHPALEIRTTRMEQPINPHREYNLEGVSAAIAALRNQITDLQDEGTRILQEGHQQHLRLYLDDHRYRAHLQVREQLNTEIYRLYAIEQALVTYNQQLREYKARQHRAPHAHHRRGGGIDEEIVELNNQRNRLRAEINTNLRRLSTLQDQLREERALLHNQVVSRLGRQRKTEQDETREYLNRLYGAMQQLHTELFRLERQLANRDELPRNAPVLRRQDAEHGGTTFTKVTHFHGGRLSLSKHHRRSIIDRRY